MPTYRWDPTPATDDYVLEKSVNKGLTWVVLATVPHDFAANYDTATASFFYVDASPIVGELVRIYGTNTEGSGEPAYVVGEALASTRCRVYGVIVNALTGAPHKDVPITITPLEAPTAATKLDNPGVAALNTFTVLGQKCVATIYTDNSGNWGIDLVRGISVQVDIPSVGFTQKFKVPSDRDVLNIVDANIYRTSATHPSTQSSWYYFGAISAWR